MLFGIAWSLGRWDYNNRQPVFTRTATIVAKRSSTSGGGSTSRFSATTWYYCTFEMKSGEREEFLVSGKQFGLLADGDVGLLTSQGTRFKGFHRIPLEPPAAFVPAHPTEEPEYVPTDQTDPRSPGSASFDTPERLA
jgi:hypothetical protein